MTETYGWGGEDYFSWRRCATARDTAHRWLGISPLLTMDKSAAVTCMRIKLQSLLDRSEVRI